jgi:hypothetical protein
MLDEYLRGLRQPIESKIPEAQSAIAESQGRLDVLGSLEGRALKEAGAEYDWAAKKVRETSINGNTEWVQEMAKAQGRDVSELSSAYRQGRVREEIFGQDTPPFASGSLGMGVVPAARSLAKSFGPWVTTLPIDLRRAINKISGTALGNKYAKVLTDSFNSRGPAGMAMTHYLLQQRDPEYNKVTTEDEE